MVTTYVDSSNPKDTSKLNLLTVLLLLKSSFIAFNLDGIKLKKKVKLNLISNNNQVCLINYLVCSILSKNLVMHLMRIIKFFFINLMTPRDFIFSLFYYCHHPYFLNSNNYFACLASEC